MPDADNFQKPLSSDDQKTRIISHQNEQLLQTQNSNPDNKGNSIIRPSLSQSQPIETTHQKVETNKEEDEERKNRQSWNNPRSNIFKIYAICFGFMVFGMNDSSIGAIVLELEDHYNTEYVIISLAFLFSFTGYLIAALICDYFHRFIGRWGTSMLAVFCQLICYIIACTKPPYAVFVLGYAIAGFGNGLLEASWNSWAGNLKTENEVLGILHGSYGLGGILSPTIETAMISDGYYWNKFYFVMIGLAGLSLVNVAWAFRDETPALYKLHISHTGEQAAALRNSDKEDNFESSTNNNQKEKSQQSPAIENINEVSEDVERNTDEPVVMGSRESLKQLFKLKILWVVSFALFTYVGAEVTMGGWVTTFMTETRHGDRDKMGYVSTGFWVGITLGRIVLGFVGGKIHREALMTAIYLSAAIVFVILFWTISQLYVSAVCIALVGFFIGPLYPSVVVVFLNKVPKQFHVNGVGVSTAFGGIGAAIMPFINGAISTTSGPKVLGPFVFSLLTAMLLSWLIVIKFF